VPQQARQELRTGRADDTLDGTRLTAEKSAVRFATTVDVLAVPAAGPAGLVLGLVPAAAAEVEPEPTLDPTLEPALVRLDAVEVGDEAIVAGAGDRDSGILETGEAVVPALL
jgi:hypothetical protein